MAEAKEENLLDAIRRRIAPWGGVELELPSRGPIREPPNFSDEGPELPDKADG